MPFDLARHPNPRVRDLIAKGRRLEVHCNKCARFRTFDAGELPLPLEEIVPALQGRFRCSRCGSRETQARPHYPDARGHRELLSTASTS
jgi:hypothetical protein